MRLREKDCDPYPTAIEMATQEVHPDPEVATKKLQDKEVRRQRAVASWTRRSKVTQGTFQDLPNWKICTAKSRVGKLLEKSWQICKIISENWNNPLHLIWLDD